MTETLTYTVEDIHYSGPLDLLLSLIEKNRYSIFDIPILEITRQYLEAVQAMQEKDLDMVSDFLLMAATLLEIKTRMLLPREEKEEEEEEDPREELVERLIQYKKYRFLAEEMAEKEEYSARILYRDPSVPEEVEKYKAPLDLDALLDGVTAEKLQKIFSEVMSRSDSRQDTERAHFRVIRKERVSLGKRIRSLAGFARNRRHFSFREMLQGEKSREEVVVTFLAILELMKMGKLEAEQKETGSDIELRATEQIDAEDLALEDIIDE